MPVVFFTRHLRAVAPSEPIACIGDTLRAALDDALRQHERLRGYVLDEQGRIRKHVAIFLDNQHLAGPDILDAPVKAESEIYVMQALSGG
jgi:molybdopterin synthase sulfur carrier subunit